jgi:hypothetical protein
MGASFLVHILTSIGHVNRAWHGEDDVARQQNPLDGPRCQDSDNAHHRHCLVFQISIVTLVLNPFVDIRCRGHITGGDIATI